MDINYELSSEQKNEEKEESVELKDEQLEDISGGTIPIINPF